MALLPPYQAFFLCLGLTKPTQIVIFVFARVMLALGRLAVSTPSPAVPIPTIPTQLLPLEIREKIRANAWPVFASLSWALIMYIFRWRPETIQPSLRSSMKYMYAFSSRRFCLSVSKLLTTEISFYRYVDSDHWSSFRNFLIHNV
jgi:peroxisomal membrane protein 4